MSVWGDRKGIEVTAACVVSLGVALLSCASGQPEAGSGEAPQEDYIESASGGIQERANAPAGFLQIDTTCRETQQQRSRSGQDRSFQ